MYSYVYICIYIYIYTLITNRILFTLHFMTAHAEVAALQLKTNKQATTNRIVKKRKIENKINENIKRDAECNLRKIY